MGVHGRRLRVADVTMYDVTRYIIKPSTQEQRSSYIERIAQDVQPPVWFVCSWWGESFRNLLDCLEQHARVPDAVQHARARPPRVHQPDEWKERCLRVQLVHTDAGRVAGAEQLDRHGPDLGLACELRLLREHGDHLGLRRRRHGHDPRRRGNGRTVGRGDGMVRLRHAREAHGVDGRGGLDGLLSWHRHLDPKHNRSVK
jgi:hypothetical protein